MIPEPISIGGKTGTVVYLDAEWHPVTPAHATMARVLFDDGSSAFFTVADRAEKREYVREPSGTSEGGQFAKAGGTSSGEWEWANYDTKKALRDYVTGSKYLNEHLRAGKGPRWADREDVALLDAHMQKNPFPEDTTVSRTIADVLVSKLEVGDIYQDDGFVSTTSKRDRIGDIRLDIGVRHDRHSILTVQVPKGLGRIVVNNELGNHDYDHQEEVILPRGLKYQVVSKGPGKELTVKVLS